MFGNPCKINYGSYDGECHGVVANALIDRQMLTGAMLRTIMSDKLKKI